jgi:uncharacterized membrane-anchored protein
MVTIPSIISAVHNFLGMLVPVIISAAVVALLYGIAMYILKTGSGDEKGYEQGVRVMLWGIIALFVMVSVWGFVAILQDMFFGGASVRPGVPPNIPFLPTNTFQGACDPVRGC